MQHSTELYKGCTFTTNLIDTCLICVLKENVRGPAILAGLFLETGVENGFITTNGISLSESN